MQPSKPSRPKRPSALTRLPLAAAIYFALGSTAFAQVETPPAQDPATTERPAVDDRQAPELGTVTVTAQKRVENLQKVPISIQVLGEQKLQQQNVTDFNDFAQLMPSVSFGSAGGGVFPGPGFVQVYMRGLSSGDNGNHSGPQPSVGMYLDEQPITTIQGALDIHVYDIARIEALAGPQGTLYGASSQAGTIRIITNKPDKTAKSSGFGLEVNAIDGGGTGHVLEGFVNLPIADNAAIRVVGWNKHQAGYVDNVLGSRTFPSWDAESGNGTITNADRAQNNYNESDTTGARAALSIDLNDNWTVTPTIMAQRQKSKGSSAFDEGVGDLELTHFYPELADDQWTQASLTVQGKIGNFDLTYAFSHLKRDVESESDYNDYGFWYDTLYGYGAYFYDDNGDLVNPSQYIQAVDGYRKTSHELRISSSDENRFRFVAGVFWQDQTHDILQRYRIDDLAADLSVRGFEDTIWLTSQQRTDRDQAVFGELSYDLTEKLTLTGGMRFFRANNGLKGYFGFADGYFSLEAFGDRPPYGEAACRALYGDDPTAWPKFRDAPCTVFDKQVKENNHLGKVNLTYQIDDNKMIYFTWSEGYRPGGINRRGTLPPYLSDFLTNYEFGWKTSWADNRFSFNGAIFQEDWENFQFSYLGLNGLTEIRNAGQAQIKGAEVELNWAATYNLNISGGFAIYDPKLTANYCGEVDANGDPITNCADPLAPSGTRLPITAKFKGNLIGRYVFDVGEYESYVQAAVIHQGDRTTDLRTYEAGLLGDLDAYTLLDLSTGFKRNGWGVDFFIKNAFDKRAELGRFAQCATAVCGNQPYTISAQPRTYSLRVSKEF